MDLSYLVFGALVSGLAVLYAVAAVAVRAHRFAYREMDRGRWDRAAAWLRFQVRWSRPPPSQRLAIEARVAAATGDTATAVAKISELLAPRTYAALAFSNEAVDVFVNAGRYARALEIPSLWDDALRAAFERKVPWAIALVQINLSEALYNLGRWDEAWRILEPLDQAAASHPVTAGGLVVQRAWILAHWDCAAEALLLLDGADATGIPASYRSETHFCRGFVLMQLRRFEDARAELARGRGCARRASSERNALFLEGHLAAARGELAEACARFEQGARHRYRGQGGDGLLAWGDALLALDRPSEARAAWSLAVERDPESAAAAMAQARLAP